MSHWGLAWWNRDEQEIVVQLWGLIWERFLTALQKNDCGPSETIDVEVFQFRFPGWYCSTALVRTCDPSMMNYYEVAWWNRGKQENVVQLWDFIWARFLAALQTNEYDSSEAFDVEVYQFRFP